MLNNLIFRRWLDIVALSLVSTTLIDIACHSQWLIRNFNLWAEITTSLPWHLQITLGGLGVYLIYKILLDFKIIHSNHWKEGILQFRYPPIYFAAILVTLGLLIFGNYSFPQPFESRIVALVAIWLSVAIALNHQKRTDELNDEPAQEKEIIFEKNIEFINHLKKVNRKDLVEFYAWIHKEEPTEINELDDFDRYVYVERIANLLLKKDGTPCHIALTGEFGSGKSSIADTAIKHIKKSSNSYIFVKVDGWGRSEKSCAAQILEEIVDSLAKHIDCSSIRNIPKHYLEALVGSNLNGSKSLASWLQKYHSPIELLRKIQNILTAIDRRLVIILEDFDRQFNSNEAISEISALLDRLKKHDKINFIINIGYQSDSEVLSKICTRREDINSITAEKKLNTLFDLMAEYDSHRNPFDINKDKSLIKQTSNDINTLIKTPRDLKQIFRRVYTTWEVLAGEIDIYDLLMLNIIRYTKPKAFDFICANIDDLKKVATDQTYAKNRTGSLQYLEKSNDFDNQYTPSPVNIFISKMFPNANDVSNTSNIDFLRNQRIAFSGETDFFRRALSENVGKNSDVSAINKIILLSGERTKETDKFILEISNSKFLIEKFIQFYGNTYSDKKQYLIQPKYVYHLLSILLDQEISPSNYKNYIERKDINFLIQVFCNLNDHDGAEEILNKICTKSLGAFSYLTNYFKINYSSISYDAIVLDAIKTPEQLKTSVADSQDPVISNTLSNIFRDSNQECIDKFMLLIIEMLTIYSDMRNYINPILETRYLDSGFEEKLTHHKAALTALIDNS